MIYKIIVLTAALIAGCQDDSTETTYSTADKDSAADASEDASFALGPNFVYSDKEGAKQFATLLEGMLLPKIYGAAGNIIVKIPSTAGTFAMFIHTSAVALKMDQIDKSFPEDAPSAADLPAMNANRQNFARGVLNEARRLCNVRTPDPTCATIIFPVASAIQFYWSKSRLERKILNTVAAKATAPFEKAIGDFVKSGVRWIPGQHGLMTVNQVTTLLYNKMLGQLMKVCGTSPKCQDLTQIGIFGLVELGKGAYEIYTSCNSKDGGKTRDEVLACQKKTGVAAAESAARRLSLFVAGQVGMGGFVTGIGYAMLAADILGWGFNKTWDDIYWARNDNFMELSKQRACAAASLGTADDGRVASGCWIKKESTGKVVSKDDFFASYFNIKCNGETRDRLNQVSEFCASQCQDQLPPTYKIYSEDGSYMTIVQSGIGESCQNGESCCKGTCTDVGQGLMSFFTDEELICQ